MDQVIRKKRRIKLRAQTILTGAVLMLAATAMLGLQDQTAQAATPPDSCFAFNAGTGTITNYYNNEANNAANPACPRDVDIPSTIGGVSVTAIGAAASYWNPATATSFAWKNLTSLNIPNSVTSIGSAAFYSNRLTSLTIPNSVTSIDNFAFGWNQLTSLTISSSVTSIGDFVFGQNQLASLTIPSSVTSIGDSAFYSNQLTSLTIPNSVTSIADGAFKYNQIATAYVGTGVANLQPSVFGFQVDLGAWGKPGTFDDWDDDFRSGDPSLVQAALDAIFFTQVYTSDPANPNNLTSSVHYEGWVEVDGDDDWDDTVAVGGYIVNPASLTISYQNTANHELSTTQRFVGQLPNSTYLANYYLTSSPLFTLTLPVDLYSLTPAEQQAIGTAFASYYQVGDEVTITPPAIAGYVAPPTQTFVLAASNNEEVIIYPSSAAGEGTTGGETADEGGSGVSADGALADTGANLLVYVVAGVAMIILPAAALVRQYRS